MRSVIPTDRFDTFGALVALVLAAIIAGVALVGQPRPLAVVAVTPPDGAGAVPTAIQVMLTFSRPVDAAELRAALSLAPDTDGFLSVAGRRAAFTPRAGFRADTDYTLTLAPGLRDRTGGTLGQPVVFRFRTRGPRLVAKAATGHLLHMGLDGAEEELAGPDVGAFDVSSQGNVAYVEPATAMLVVRTARTRDVRRIALPRQGARFAGYGSGSAVRVRALTWAPDGLGIGFLGTTGDGASVPYVVRFDEDPPVPRPLGPPPDLHPPGSSAMSKAVQATLADIVYGQDTFAFTPDRRGAIVRDRTWDFVVLGFDGRQRGIFGAFLAVGNVSAAGDLVAFVDVSPGGRPEPRQVVAYEPAGRLRTLSDPRRDSHSPRFAHRTARVAFAASTAPTGDRPYAIEVMELASGRRRQVTSPPRGQTDEDPRWSFDDAWISFRRVTREAPGRGTVLVVPVEGGAERPLPVPATDARWSP
jgi:Bacterial Ig-like domain